MYTLSIRPPLWRIFFCLLIGLCLLPGTAAWAQNGDDGGGDGGFQVGENGAPQADIPADINGDTASQGPVRLARFSYIKGNVTWRADDSQDWSQATLNLPLRQGAQIWVNDGGRAEIQFDDGSLLRLGNGAVVALQTLYSDADGEFTELKMTDGLALLRVKHDHSVFQVDTPLVSIKAGGPAKVRIGVGDGVEVGIPDGRATVEGMQGKVTLEAGDYLDLADSNSAYDVRPMPRPDSWQQWNDDRDRQLEEIDRGESSHHLPANITIVAGDLDDYGTWRDDSRYGYVWCPRAHEVDWRPYYYGHWTWCNPFGWTWVSEEPWGWAPYHYGTWVYQPYGWAWVPGPVTQCWSPAVVHFCEFEGRVAWVPLAPVEVHYPAVLSIGFRSGNWSAFFSIGQAAVYYPSGGSYFVARPWNTTYVNRVTYVTNVTNVTNVYNNTPAQQRYFNSAEYFAANHNTYLANRSYIPVNARSAAGVTVASASAFGGQGRYEAVPRGTVTYFAEGRSIGAPAIGRAPVAGPVAVKPTVQALSPTRTFVREAQPPTRTLTRPVYHAAVQPTIARNSAPITPTGRVLPIQRTNSGFTSGSHQDLPDRGQSTTHSTDSGRVPTSSSGYPRRSTGDNGATSTGSPRRTTGDSGTTSGGYQRRQTGDNGATSTGYPRRQTGDSGTSSGTTGATGRTSYGDRTYGNRGGTQPDNSSGTTSHTSSGNSGSSSSSAADAARRARADLGIPSRGSNSGSTGTSSSGSSGTSRTRDDGTRSGSNGTSSGAPYNGGYGRNGNSSGRSDSSSSSSTDRRYSPPNQNPSNPPSHSPGYGNGNPSNPPYHSSDSGNGSPGRRSSDSGSSGNPPHQPSNSGTGNGNPPRGSDTSGRHDSPPSYHYPESPRRDTGSSGSSGRSNSQSGSSGNSSHSSSGGGSHDNSGGNSHGNSGGNSKDSSGGRDHSDR